MNRQPDVAPLNRLHGDPHQVPLQIDDRAAVIRGDALDRAGWQEERHVQAARAAGDCVFGFVEAGGFAVVGGDLRRGDGGNSGIEVS